MQWSRKVENFVMRENFAEFHFQKGLMWWTLQVVWGGTSALLSSPHLLDVFELISFVTEA